MAKYGMSMCVLGMSEELKPDGIAVNALWPRTGMCVICVYIIYVCSVGGNVLHNTITFCGN